MGLPRDPGACTYGGHFRPDGEAAHLELRAVEHGLVRREPYNGSRDIHAHGARGCLRRVQPSTVKVCVRYGVE
jgi:hypothetical protein